MSTALLLPTMNNHLTAQLLWELLSYSMDTFLMGLHATPFCKWFSTLITCEWFYVLVNSIMCCQWLLWCETFTTFVAGKLVDLFCVTPVDVEMYIKFIFGIKPFAALITGTFFACIVLHVFVETIFSDKSRFANITLKPFINSMTITFMTKQLVEPGVNILRKADALASA